MASEYFEIAKKEMLSRNPKLSVTLIDTPGAQSNTDAHAIAAVCEALEYEVVQEFARLHLSTSEGESLRRLVYDLYNLVWLGASAAQAPVTLSRSLSTELTVPSGTVIQTVNQDKFTLDEDVYWPEGDSTDKSTTATCTSAGVNGNVKVNTLVQFTAGAPEPGMTVTNTEAAAGGNDEETDGALVRRARNFWKGLPGGTLAAIRNGALAVPAVREASVFEPVDNAGYEIGIVNLVVSDKSGTSNTALTDDVVASLVNWRGAGIHVATTGGSVVYEPVEVQVIWKTGYATTTNKQAVKRNVVAVVNELSVRANESAPEPECILYPSMVEAAARQIVGVLSAICLTPSGRLPPISVR